MPVTGTDAIDHGRVAPGTIMAGRYRMIGRLGSGGMGEVYRADDLELAQPVALKFLPEAVDKDPARLTQIHNEVRIARQISHPHVCRVHDIDEYQGHTFLSMEYVDGEDLASLLRRVARRAKSAAQMKAAMRSCWALTSRSCGSMPASSSSRSRCRCSSPPAPGSSTWRWNRSSGASGPTA